MPSIFFMPPPYTQGFAVLKINEKANRLQKKNEIAFKTPESIKNCY